MRLNRGTLILLAAAVLIIVVIAVLNNNQASAPGTPTATPGAVTAALLPVTLDTVRTVEIVNNADGTSTTLNADARGTWRISASNPADRDPDQDYITTQVTNLIALQGENAFEAAESELGNFGLATPANIIRVNADGTLYTLFIGGSNPAGNRFYVALQTSAAAPEATPEATPNAEATPDLVPSVATGALTQSLLLAAPPQETVTLTGTQTVYLVARGTITTFANLVASPPYLPPPTATPTPTATLNPLSEVQIATATAEAIATQQAQANATATAIIQTATAQAAEATAETTPES
jgi:hypothetical protein